MPTLGRGDVAPDLAVAWTVRGAPHVHREAELPAVAARCLPLDTTDATARLASSGARLRDAGVDPLGAMKTTAQAVRRVLTTTMAKGTLNAAVTAAVTAAVPEGYSTWCRPCGSRHITDTLLRGAALAGGARIVPGSVPVTFEPAVTPMDPAASLAGVRLRRHRTVGGLTCPARSMCFDATSVLHSRSTTPERRRREEDACPPARTNSSTSRAVGSRSPG